MLKAGWEAIWEINENEFVIVPKQLEHRPVATEEASQFLRDEKE